MRRDHTTHGFTLVSLLSSMAISSILLGLGIPATSSLLESNKLTAEINVLQHQLAYARNTAVEFNQNIVLCKSNDQKSCTTDGTWSQGWIMFRDTNQDLAHDADEPILQVQGKVRTGLEINYSGFGTRQQIVFRGTGTTSTNGTFTFCGTQHTGVSGALVINRMGRIRVDNSGTSCVS